MPRSPLLEKQWALFEQQQYEEAFQMTQSAMSGLQGEDLRDAQRLMGLACYHKHQYERAVFWLMEACKGSANAQDWLHLALAAAMQGHQELSAQAFEQVRLCQQAAKYAQEPGWYLQLYWYACALCDSGQCERALPLLNELASAYKRLRHSDTIYLRARDMPFLSSFLDLVVRCFRALARHAEGTAWLEELAQALDPPGQRQVCQAIEEIWDMGNGKRKT
nr:hypothetical protein [Chloroflexota bacterium]